MGGRAAEDRRLGRHGGADDLHDGGGPDGGRSHTVRYEWYHGVGPATARLSWAEVSTSILGPAEALHPGNWRTSADGHYWIRVPGRQQPGRSGGSTGEVAWESGTTGTGTPMIVAMQYDGNLVMYAEGWQPVWSTGTAGHPGAWLQLANDELVLRDPEGVALWTVSLGPPLLTKQAPAHGATVTGERGDADVDGGGRRELPACAGTRPRTRPARGRGRRPGPATTLTVNGRGAGHLLLAGEDGGRRRAGRQRDVAQLHGRGGAALRQAGAGHGHDRAGESGDAAVDGGLRRRATASAGTRRTTARATRRGRPNGARDDEGALRAAGRDVLLAGEDDGERRRGGRRHVVELHGDGAVRAGGSLEGGVLRESRR